MAFMLQCILIAAFLKLLLNVTFKRTVAIDYNTVYTGYVLYRASSSVIFKLVVYHVMQPPFKMRQACNMKIVQPFYIVKNYIPAEGCIDTCVAFIVPCICTGLPVMEINSPQIVTYFV